MAAPSQNITTPYKVQWRGFVWQVAGPAFKRRMRITLLAEGSRGRLLRRPEQRYKRQMIANALLRIIIGRTPIRTGHLRASTRIEEHGLSQGPPPWVSKAPERRKRGEGYTKGQISKYYARNANKVSTSVPKGYIETSIRIASNWGVQLVDDSRVEPIRVRDVAKGRVSSGVDATSSEFGADQIYNNAVERATRQERQMNAELQELDQALIGRPGSGVQPMQRRLRPGRILRPLRSGRRIYA